MSSARRPARLRESVAATQLPQLQRGQDTEKLKERGFATRRRIALAKQGHAIPVRSRKGKIVGGRYPIETAKDVRDAVADADRTGAGEDVRSHIIRQADRIGASKELPKRWRKRTRETVSFTTQLREAQVSKVGRAYECTLIREGPGNPSDRNAYSKEALRRAVADGKFDGLQAYANHSTPSEERERPERDVRQLVGHFREARFQDGTPAEVRAKFVPISGPGYEWVTSLIESALAAPEDKPLIGISIDGHGDAPDTKEIAGRTYNVVREITHLGSADIVTNAGAGGKFHRRLSESLAGVQGVPVEGLKLRPGKLQKRLREALHQLGDALAVEDDDAAEAALRRLHETAEASVTPVVPKVRVTTPGKGVAPDKHRRLQEKLAKEHKRRVRAQERAGAAERAAVAHRLLRELSVPQDTREAWLPELIDQPTKKAMRRHLDHRLQERDAYLNELRESYGLNEGIVGAGRRAYTVPAGPPTLTLLERVGLDRDELQGG